MTKNFSNGEGRKGVGEATACVSSGQKKKQELLPQIFISFNPLYGFELSFILRMVDCSRCSIHL
jgi:hypothetical protein